MSMGKILVYGGRGALGAACVSHFKLSNWWVANVDITNNEEADFNIEVPRDASLVHQEKHVVYSLGTTLQGEQLDAVICVAGGRIFGNATNDLCKQADLMWRQSVWSSLIAGTIASKYMSRGGVLALSGAKHALESTPRMIGYGMAQAAVHHLTKSLGAIDSGLPENSLAVAVLPMVLDTERNRKWMPEADFSTWTPLSFVAELFEKWIEAPCDERPPNGSLVQLVTKDNVTKVIVPAEGRVFDSGIIIK